MTVRVLVVDDEPDVEVLFRQQFRREVREGHYTIDFALSGEAALKKARWAGRWRDRPTGVGHQHAGHERPRSSAGGERTATRPAGVHDLGLW